MATASPWKDMDEKFCLCSICLEQLKEPKLLPCLHRYCKDCLDSILQGSHDVIKCPECREEIEIPTNGADGFKTDFYSKNLVEYVQMQESLRSDEVRECYSCSKYLRVAAYCFKCNDFLCKDCYNFHMTNKTLKDHRKHTLSLEDIEKKNISIESFAFMRDTPRCHNHPEIIFELYCETCSNTPVCITCMLGDHKGHNLVEVTALAKSKREELSKKLETLEKVQKDRKLLNPRNVQEKLALNVSIEKEKLTKVHNEKTQEIMRKTKDTERRQEQVKTEKQNAEKQMIDSLQKEMEDEINRVKKRYEEISKVKMIQISADFQLRERCLEKDLMNLYEKRENFDRDKKELFESIEKQLDNNNAKIIETMSEHSDNFEKRLQTLKVMASSVLVFKHDWSAVQYIPDMCTAATNLLEDLTKVSTELTSLTDVTVNYNRSSLVETSISKISEQVERELTIDDKYHFLNGGTSSGDGNIVLSGCPSEGGGAFIIVIDVNGKIIKRKTVNAEVRAPYHFCDFLPQNRVVTVCEPNKIVLYDVRDGSYIEKNINDIINSWPKGRYLRCVATDPVNNHILVGGEDSRDVYVFDGQLNYLHILTLPDIIKWPRDITVSNGHLLVCDWNGKKVYTTTMEGLRSKVVVEFVKPDVEGDDWRPCSVCTDTNGLLYMLWKEHWLYGPSHLVQYTHDGRQLLATRKVDDDAFAVATIETPQGEKLVVITFTTQKVYFFSVLNEK